jgi:hypothetical protein
MLNAGRRAHASRRLFLTCITDFRERFQSPSAPPSADATFLSTTIGPLKQDEARETLFECKRRPRGKACAGLMWVVKTSDDTASKEQG